MIQQENALEMNETPQEKNQQITLKMLQTPSNINEIRNSHDDH